MDDHVLFSKRQRIAEDARAWLLLHGKGDLPETPHNIVTALDACGYLYLKQPSQERPQEDKGPPLGAKPEILYKEERLRDLAGSIYRFIEDGRFGGKDAVTVGVWCDELSRRLKEFA